MHSEAKIWIYQADRALIDNELRLAEDRVGEFVKSWAAHGVELSSFGEIRHNLFVILAVDERKYGASGCSIDGSVRFITDLGKELGVDFFDRMRFAVLVGDEIRLLDRTSLESGFAEGKYNSQTLFFDNLVADYGAYQSTWLKPIGGSWLEKLVG